MFTLRGYQREALYAIVEATKKQKNILVQAATGAGKTILFSALVRHLFKTKKKAKVYIVAHREQLVSQAKDKLLKVWPDCKSYIGIACASSGKKVDIHKPIVIGSQQTLGSFPDVLPPADMMIIDECHRLAPANKKSIYKKLIDSMREKQPEMRLVGVTATPYRLGQGFIFGDNCKNKNENWFDSLCFSINTELLQKQGYLCPLRLFAPVDPDLSKVGTANGDYIVKQLSETMSKAIHVHSAIHAVEQHAKDRKHIVVFAVTIQHAEILRDAFRETGKKAEAIHSKIPHSDRIHILEAFEKGNIDVLCNVGVLTEGWDCKTVDCMVMCRPTKSTSLYVQMAGRGLRTSQKKEDCMLLDVSGNWARHGRPENPQVKKAKQNEKDAQQGKRCPECGFINKQNTTKCEACGFCWPEQDFIICKKCLHSNKKTAIACEFCGEIFNEAKTVDLVEVPNDACIKPLPFGKISGTLVFLN